MTVSVTRMTDCFTGTHVLLVSEGSVLVQEREADQLYGDDASGRPAVVPAVHDHDGRHREAAEPAVAEASDAEPAAFSWDQAASDASAADPGIPAHPPQDPPEGLRIAAPMDIPAPGTPVDESALENDVDEIFRQLINDAASEVGPPVQPAPLQPAAHVDIVDGLLRQTMEESIGEMGPQVQSAPLQPSGNANQPTRALSGRRPLRTLRHMAPWEPSQAQAAPNASSDTTFSAAAFILYAFALGQASMQPSSEAGAATQMMDDVSTGQVGSAAARDDGTADALTTEGNEADSNIEADGFVSRDAASADEVSQDAGISMGALIRDSATADATTGQVNEDGGISEVEADSHASTATPNVNTEAKDDAGITGDDDAPSNETVGDDNEQASEGHLSREEVKSDASAAASAARDSSAGNAAMASTADSTSTAAAPSLAGTPQGPTSPQVAHPTSRAGGAQGATSAEGNHLAPQGPTIPYTYHQGTISAEGHQLAPQGPPIPFTYHLSSATSGDAYGTPLPQGDLQAPQGTWPPHSGHQQVQAMLTGFQTESGVDKQEENIEVGRAGS